MERRQGKAVEKGIYSRGISPVDSVNSQQQRQDEEKRLIEELELDEIERLEALRKIREERIPPEPANDTSTRIEACVNHSFNRDVCRFFLASDQMRAVYGYFEDPEKPDVLFPFVPLSYNGGQK